ncbi:transketolase [Pseudomonadota bacterium]
MEIPALGSNLNKSQIKTLEATAKSCRKTIIEMLKQSQSGHPGGSLSTIDYLALLYSYIISQTGEKIVISNGHISPAVYAILAELNYIPKQGLIDTFRQLGSVYEGHVARIVPGVHFGTGPLGVGVSAAAGFAKAEKMKGSDGAVYAIMGDGEAQEGQVHEMAHFASKYKLDNFIVFIDYNRVQLTASLKEVLPIDLEAVFKAAGWEVLKADGHNFEEMWEALGKAKNIKDKPIIIIGNTIMGKGVDFMEEEGKADKSTWHGNAPKPEQADEAIKQLQISPEEESLITELNTAVKWNPASPDIKENFTPVEIDQGEPILYAADEVTDCRTAYGKALLDLAKRNKNVIALTADLRGSVMTKFVAEELPEQHIEVGIAEQNMVSVAGGMSLDGFLPFASTFGAFLSSRAKDQARVNDINHANVKMVATHCGLSVGEDGPTHQAIDDMNSFTGMFNTMVIEPADPNQTDRIIRYVASNWGNCYVRMGRHKFPIITKKDGTPFYDENYVYEYGKTDTIREGTSVIVVATGATVNEALKAIDLLKESAPEMTVKLIAASSIKKFDSNLEEALRNCKKVISVEDHNVNSGLGVYLSSFIADKGIDVEKIVHLGVKEYQYSAPAPDLYKNAGIDSEAIEKACKQIQ